MSQKPKCNKPMKVCPVCGNMWVSDNPCWMCERDKK